jgi:NDP-sugar pyrophosphorylase family protein
MVNDVNGPIPTHQHPNGGGLVADTAQVDDSVYIGSNVQIYGEVKISGDVQIYDSVRISDNVQISGSVIISDNAQIWGNAHIHGKKVCIYGNAHIYNAEITGKARVCDHAMIFGNAQIGGSAQISGYAEIKGNARISGRAEISGESVVYGGTWTSSPLQIQGTRHFFNISAPGEIQIGCENHTIDEWLLRGSEIAKEYGYTDAENQEYRLYVKLAETLTSKGD